MTVNEAAQYCRLRAEGAGLFERNAQESMRWYRAWEQLDEASQAGYGQWPVEAVIAAVEGLPAGASAKAGRTE